MSLGKLAMFIAFMYRFCLDRQTDTHSIHPLFHQSHLFLISLISVVRFIQGGGGNIF